MSSQLDKVVAALNTLTYAIQNVNNKVQGIEFEIQIVDFHSQPIAMLETQLGQLVIAVNKREEGNFQAAP